MRDEEEEEGSEECGWGVTRPFSLLLLRFHQFDGYHSVPHVFFYIPYQSTFSLFCFLSALEFQLFHCFH